MPLNLAPLRALKQRIPEAVAESARERILPLSNQYIPKDTETAEMSGRVVRDGDRIVVTYGRGDDSNPKTGQPSNAYIEALHEDMEMRHAPGTGAKFLQRAADEAGPGMGEDVARRVKGG